MSTHRTLVLTTWFCHQFVKIKMREKKRNIKLSFQRIYTCGSTRLFFIRSTRCIALEQIRLLLCLQLVWSRLVVWLLFLSNVPPFELRLQFERRKTSSFEYIQGTSTLLQIIEKKGIINVARWWRAIDLTFFIFPSLGSLGKARKK